MNPAVLLKKFLATLGIKNLVKLPEKIEINILNGNRKHEITNNYTNLTINLQALSPEENTAFAEYMRALKENNENYLVMEKKSYSVIQELHKINSDFKAIEKLQTILLPEDYGALEDAVYIKYLKDNRRFAEIYDRKKQIRYDYGERGNTITNLYTAGYFHDIFLPLYDELSKDPTTLEEFKFIFDKLIRDFPLAVFINFHMGLDEVKNLIKDKILKNKKYGIDKLYIHGINKQNCDNIKEAIKILEEEGEITFTKNIEQISDILMVKLEFNHEPQPSVASEPTTN
ncbi:MAG: hypothetical protein KGI00_01570 [Candidatus Micrarchaeota archaeon]|nr:hypothetical protein [Planctomycetota bacterium]MDE1849398.1 hypothetical protein [Candidatus Micrarchaeota archaeon]